MSEVIQLTRDPTWLASLSLITDETVIFLRGDDLGSQVQVPAALLIASSPLVRNILSADHIPPAFSTPVVSIPVSVEILEGVVEMLVSGMASMDRTRICGVREVFKMLGIEDRIVVQTENLVNYTQRGNLVNIKSEECFEDGQIESSTSKIEIVVKLEKEPKVENPVILFNRSEKHGSSAKKKLQVRIARLKLAGNYLHGKESVKCVRSVHMGIDSSESIPCHLCDKDFKIKANLQRHLETHLGIKKFQCVDVFPCHLCDKQFNTNCNLQSHISSHFGMKIHQCVDCGKLYRTDRSLHLGQKKYQCQECEKTFTRISFMKVHKLTHTNETPYKCQYCSQGYKEKRNLMKHIEKFHQTEIPVKTEETYNNGPTDCIKVLERTGQMTSPRLKSAKRKLIEKIEDGKTNMKLKIQKLRSATANIYLSEMQAYNEMRAEVEREEKERKDRVAKGGADGLGSGAARGVGFGADCLGSGAARGVGFVGADLQDLLEKKARTICKAKKNHRFKACAKCTGCRRENCGNCEYCLDMPKFGGMGVIKQKCQGRVCVNPSITTCDQCVWII